MSSKEVKQQLDNLLAHNWGEEQKSLLSRIFEHITYYNRFMPKTMKEDILAILLLANGLKTELDDLKK